MRVMILGAGYNQIYAIQKIKDMGHKALVSDYNLDSPGKMLGDASFLASTFSYEETLAAAMEAGVDAIYTSGSDQPVYIAALVAEKLGLPSNLDSQTAYLVTNKQAMKERFYETGIPCLKSQLVGESIREEDVTVGFPAVLKPQDSQGQRGLYLVRSYGELKGRLAETLAASRADEAVLESYYPSDEITVSGWVRDGRAKILSICDRLRFSDEEKLGICVAHEYPSQYTEEYMDQVRELTGRIVREFGIGQGPIYFQMLIGDQGLYVNEIACRIGGAFEDIYIEKCLGADIARLQILEALGQRDKKDYEGIDAVHFPSGKHLAVELFFAMPGTVTETSDRASLRGLPGVIDADLYYHVGDIVDETRTASQRAGFAVIEAPDRTTLEDYIEAFYSSVQLLDDTGRNLILKRGTSHEI